MEIVSSRRLQGIVFRGKIMDISGYQPKEIEKIHRLFAILEQIGNIKFLSDRLSFYGGTALNFIHFKDIPRLSVDLDFNYRHVDEDRDWGEVRKEIDRLIMRILRDLGYNDNSIKVQASYPLGRFDVKYQSVGRMRDNIKIEIGYMRRIPLLSNDMTYRVINPKTGSEFHIRSPIMEELFANKYCTMISRNRTQMNSRDVFDVNSISRIDIDFDLFIDMVMIEGLLMELNLSDPQISLNSGSLGIIQDLVLDDVDVKLICECVNSFNVRVFEELDKRGWKDFKEKFIIRKEVDLGFIKSPEKINEKLNEHPQVRWILSKG